MIIWLRFCGCNTFSANCGSSLFFTNSAAATDKQRKIDSVRMFEADPWILLQQMSLHPIECDWNRMLWVYLFFHYWKIQQCVLIKLNARIILCHAINTEDFNWGWQLADALQRRNRCIGQGEQLSKWHFLFFF